MRRNAPGIEGFTASTVGAKYKIGDIVHRPKEPFLLPTIYYVTGVDLQEDFGEDEALEYVYNLKNIITNSTVGYVSESAIALVELPHLDMVQETYESIVDRLGKVEVVLDERAARMSYKDDSYSNKHKIQIDEDVEDDLDIEEDFAEEEDDMDEGELDESEDRQASDTEYDRFVYGVDQYGTELLAAGSSCC